MRVSDKATYCLMKTKKMKTKKILSAINRQNKPHPSGANQNLLYHRKQQASLLNRSTRVKFTSSAKHLCLTEQVVHARGTPPLPGHEQGHRQKGNAWHAARAQNSQACLWGAVFAQRYLHSASVFASLSSMTCRKCAQGNSLASISLTDTDSIFGRKCVSLFRQSKKALFMTSVCCV